MKLDIYDNLLKIYGIGITKATELVEEYNIRSISERSLQENKDLLNNQQKISLKHIKDIQILIPRKEIEQHYKFLSKIIDDKLNLK